MALPVRVATSFLPTELEILFHLPTTYQWGKMDVCRSETHMQLGFFEGEPSHLEMRCKVSVCPKSPAADKSPGMQ